MIFITAELGCWRTRRAEHSRLQSPNKSAITLGFNGRIFQQNPPKSGLDPLPLM
jgi:hypothetical protein